MKKGYTLKFEQKSRTTDNYDKNLSMFANNIWISFHFHNHSLIYVIMETAGFAWGEINRYVLLPSPYGVHKESLQRYKFINWFVLQSVKQIFLTNGRI